MGGFLMLVFMWGLRSNLVVNFFAGMGKGSRDEVVSQFTDVEVSVSSGLRDQLLDCEPWSDHLTNEGIKMLNRAVLKQNPNLAKEVIDKSLTETTAPWCIKALKTAVVLVCTKRPSILKEALPTSFY